MWEYRQRGFSSSLSIFNTTVCYRKYQKRERKEKKEPQKHYPKFPPPVLIVVNHSLLSLNGISLKLPPFQELHHIAFSGRWFSLEQIKDSFSHLVFTQSQPQLCRIPETVQREKAIAHRNEKQQNSILLGGKELIWRAGWETLTREAEWKWRASGSV